MSLTVTKRKKPQKTPNGRKRVGTTWVFTYETTKEDLVEKTKARLVANMFKQVQDVDFIQTFAPPPSLDLDGIHGGRGQ